MAKAKVATTARKKKSRREELKEPDEVMSQLQKFSEHLNKHFRLYIAGLAALILVVLGFNSFVEWRQSVALSNSKAVEGTMATIHGSVQSYVDQESLVPPTGDEKDDVKATYADDKSRWSAALESANSVQKEAKGGLKSLAAAAGARAQMGLKDWTSAETAFAAAQGESKDSLFTPLLTKNRGRVAEAEGKIDAASSHYTELSNSSDTYYQVRGKMLLGDLYNPNMGTAKSKDNAKARKHYESALAVLVPAEGQVLSTPMRALRTEIHRRYTLIK